jgi:hypothetical protein
MRLFKTYKTEIVLAVLALAVHIAVFALVVHANGGDALAAVRGDDGFYELAENIRAGNGFSWSASAPYAPNPLRTPGYSYVLAACIALFGVVGAAMVQLFSASLLPIFGMWISERIANSRTIGVIAGVILALDPTLALLSFQFYTETLFLILFFLWTLVALNYLERKSPAWLIAGAVLIGCAILVRTSAQYVALLFVAFILWQHGRVQWRRGLAHASLYLLIVGAILAPWVIRNAQVFGVPGLSAQTPFVLYTNLAPAVLTTAHNSTFAVELETFLTEEEFRGNAITLANGDAYTERALDVVLAHPGATLFVAAKSLFTFFTNDGFYTLLVRGGYEPNEFLATLIGARLVWIAITLAAVVGAGVVLATERSPRAVFVVLLVVYFALTSTVAAFGTNPRYRLPVDPIIIALAGVGGAFLLVRTRGLKDKLHLW